MSTLLPPPRPLTKGVAVTLGIPFLLGLALLTLTPSRVEDSVPGILDLVLSGARRIGWDWLDFDRLEVISNVLVFVPVGIFAFLLVPRRLWLVAVLIGPAISVGIELTQRLAIPERAATVTDVIANSSGALMGVGIAMMCTLLFAPQPAVSPAAARPRTLEAP